MYGLEKKENYICTRLIYVKLKYCIKRIAMKTDLIESWKQETLKRIDGKLKIFNLLGRREKEEVDQMAASLHEAVFNEIDCLDCANCCKTTPALLTNADIKRIAKFLQMSPALFKRKYVLEDVNGDQSFKKVPCVFLEKDNKCKVYEVRPEACKDYPHTSAPGFLKRRKLHKENISICPAVFHILDRME